MAGRNGHDKEADDQSRSALFRRALCDELYANGFFDAAAAMRKERLQEPAYYLDRLQALQAWSDSKHKDVYELEGVWRRG